MPDTHDGGSSGDESPFRAAFDAAIAVLPVSVAVVQVEQAVLAALQAAAPLQQAQLRDQLAAATARAEKAEARLAALAAIQKGAWTAALDRLRTDAMTADAAQDGLSATETDAKASQASREGSNSSASPQGPQGPEPCDWDCDCDCQPGQPCFCPERDCYCGPCRVCGDTPQQHDDDTTEER